MRKSRFTEAQIIGMLKEQEAGMPVAEMCRRHGLSPATFYKLKSKYGGVISPFLTGSMRRIHAAIFSFWAGVMPPMPMFGRSLL